MEPATSQNQERSRSFERMLKLFSHLKTTTYFLLFAGLSAVSTIFFLSLVFKPADTFLLASTPPQKSVLALGKYFLSFNLAATIGAIYAFLIWFRREDVSLDSKVAYSLVLSILTISSVRFLSYFLSESSYSRVSGFFLDIVYLTPLILILAFSREVLIKDNFEVLSSIGEYVQKWRSIVIGWLIIPISAIPMLLIEFTILAPYSSVRIWILGGPTLLVLTLISAKFIRDENLEDRNQLKGWIMSEVKKIEAELLDMNYDDLLEKGREQVSEEEGSAERFEMPEVKSRKKGSNTAIENFSEIADDLGREEKHLSKFIQSEMGTSGQIEGKELVLNGEFRRGHVQSKVEDYADEYVICPECNRPDTKLTKEKGVEIMKCQACGARTVVE